MSPVSERARRQVRVVPGYGKRLSAIMDKYDLNLADLGHLACLSSATISRAVHKDLVSRRTEERIAAAVSGLRSTPGRRRSSWRPADS